MVVGVLNRHSLGRALYFIWFLQEFLSLSACVCVSEKERDTEREAYLGDIGYF